MKTKVLGSVSVNVYDVVARAVEEGITHGLRRAFKYTDTPGQEHMEEELYSSIMRSLNEVLIFSGEDIDES